MNSDKHSPARALTDNDGMSFPEALMNDIKKKFCYVDSDRRFGDRLFFDNAGGSFRLKRANEVFAEIDSNPDCPGHSNQMAQCLAKVRADGINDLKTLLNADRGVLFTALTASEAMFDLVRAVAENTAGKNMVTTILEHPSAFDSMAFYAGRLGKELRVAKSNPETGGVDAEEIIKLIDQDTCLLNVMYASNISGTIHDLEAIVRAARAINPEIYILVDAVQHAPHGLIDLKQTPVDGITFAPYKFFGCRGIGIAWLSERAAKLPHHKELCFEAEHWDLGSPTPAHFAVLSEIVDYVSWIGSKYISSANRRELFAKGMTQIALHERALMSAMYQGIDGIPGLREIKNLELVLDCKDLTIRDLIVAIGFKNLEINQAVSEYEKRGVIVFERVTSSPFSKRMLESFNMSGAVRVSPLHCNSLADIKRFLVVTGELSEL
jgi:selenocysteine lyase/cysteine desulfurase